MSDAGSQPQPLAAIELIANEPIRLIQGRVASCDGGASPARSAKLTLLGGGSLGHPKVRQAAPVVH